MAASPRPAVQVLANRLLFRHVASFMDGLPLDVARFARAQRHRPRVEGRYPSSRGLLPQLAVICNDVAVLSALLHHVAIQMQPNTETEFFGVVRCAVRFDRLNMLQWLEEHLDLSQYAFEAGLLDIAVSCTQGVEIMEWLLVNHTSMNARVSTWALHIAAYNGDLAKMRWLHNHEFQGFSSATADDAACAGHLPVLRFLLERRAEGCSSRALDLAATYGVLEVVRYLFEYANGGVNRQRVLARASFAMTKAALRGHADVVAFLGQQRCTPLMNTLLDVVAAGKLQVLRALCRYSNEGCLVEARNRAKTLGLVEVVTFLSTQIAPTVWTCKVQRHSRSGPRRCQRKTGSV